MRAEHRLPFKGAMVAARRELGKDVTRRVITRINSTVDGGRWGQDAWEALDFGKATVGRFSGEHPNLHLRVPMPREGTVHRVRPVYQPGDLLLLGEALEREPDEGHPRSGPLAVYSHDKARVVVEPSVAEAWGWTLYGGKWLLWPWQRSSQPSIFCPRELVRDKAVVISCRPERVQEITPEDVRREGVEAFAPGLWAQLHQMRHTPIPPAEVEFFADCWDEINQKRGHGWEANGFVWRLEMTKFGEAGGDNA